MSSVNLLSSWTISFSVLHQLPLEFRNYNFNQKNRSRLETRCHSSFHFSSRKHTGTVNSFGGQNAIAVSPVATIGKHAPHPGIAYSHRRIVKSDPRIWAE